MNPIETRLHLLVERLRRAGAPVGMTELVDAFQATAVLEIADRSTWRAGLRACLIKSAEHVDVFDDLFDRIFPLADAKSLARSDFDEHSNLGRASTSDGRRSPLRSDQLEADVLDAIGRDDRSALRALAVEAVTACAALGAGGSSEKQYAMRVLRALDLANLLQRALRAARTSAGVDGVADYLGRSQAMEFNHACTPNCYVQITDGIIWIRAAKTIRKGTELNYNYNTDGEATIKCRCRPGCKNSL